MLVICRLLLVAGNETTTSLLGNTLAALLANRDQLDLLRRRPELVRPALEESLRFDAPFQGLYRTPAGRHVDPNEAVQSDRWRDEGIAYARHHAVRLPAVVAARVGRTWELFPFSPIERAAISEMSA